MKHCNPYKTKPELIRDAGQKGHREGFPTSRNIKDILWNTIGSVGPSQDTKVSVCY